MSTKEYGTDKKLETKVCYLGIGSNKGDRLKNLENSLKFLASEAGKITKYSKIYETEPWGQIDQKFFLNQVVEIKTNIDPFNLLKVCKNIEINMGRKNTKKWSERIIDIDILYYSSLIINNDNLTIPHPFIHKRNFVIIPLIDLNKNYRHPVLNLTNIELLNICNDKSNVSEYGNL
tara:strand:- start:1085 stop:1612 length:528 start_codon:yes stop_codon:yes gene_type:complete